MKFPYDLENFPVTRYQGSKRKILPWMYSCFKKIEFDSVLDGFGGTGVVSYLLKNMGKEVTYNDNLKFNYLIGKAIIENSNITINEKDVKKILHPISNEFNFISDNFKDIYFLNDENKWLDKTLFSIYNMNSYSDKVVDVKKALALYSIFQACLIKRPFNLFHRKNLYIRTNDVERNFGNKVSWDRPFEEYFKMFISEVNKLVFDSNKKCFALNEDIFKMEKTDYDLVYFDPPYLNSLGNNETRNYLKVYHFLEGLANYNNWKDKIDFKTKNKRFKKEEELPYFEKTNVYENYRILFAKYSKSKIVISYKIGGIPSIDFFKKELKRQGKKVSTKSIHYKYALNRQNGNAKKNREVLIIAQ